MPAVSPDEVEPRPVPVGEDEPAAASPRPTPTDGAVEVEVDGAPPRPPTEALPQAPGRALAPAHVERAGWSADGETFVHCRSIAPECTECRLLHRDGLTESLPSGPGCDHEAVLSPEALTARLSALALAPDPARWSIGREVVLLVETREHEQTNDGQPRPMLKLGARRREGGLPAWLLHVDPCQGCGTDQECAAVAHFDALAPAPDGQRLAVLIHQRSSQGDESTRVELLHAERIVAAARAPASRARP